MNILESSKRRIDSTLKELTNSRPQQRSRKKSGVDTNIMTPEMIAESIQTRALTSIKNETVSSSNNRRGNSSSQGNGGHQYSKLKNHIYSTHRQSPLKDLKY